MKYAALALLGAATADDTTKFMQESNELELLQLGSGMCFNYANDFSRFYDLKSFDAMRDAPAELPALVAFGGNEFFYKACNPAWSMTADSYKNSGGAQNFSQDKWDGAKVGTAYWTNAGSPAYTFVNSEISTLAANDDGTITQGWDVVWTSVEDCSAEAGSKFTVKITGTCDESVKDAKVVASSQNTCAAYATLAGPQAGATEIPIQKAFKTLAPFLGVFLILFGAVMCFYGRKFLFVLVGLTVGFASTAIIFGVSYALFLPLDTETPLLAGVILISVALGFTLAYLTFKFTKTHATSILSAIGGVVIALMILKIFAVKSSIITIAVAVLGAAAGFFIGKKFQNLLKAVSTALIGSFFIVRGFGCYLPGWSTDMGDFKDMAQNPNQNLESIGYLAGFIILTVAGIIIQLKYTREEVEEAAKDDDNYDLIDGQEESRICGCF